MYIRDKYGLKFYLSNQCTCIMPIALHSLTVILCLFILRINLELRQTCYLRIQNLVTQCAWLTEIGENVNFWQLLYRRQKHSKSSDPPEAKSMNGFITEVEWCRRMRRRQVYSPNKIIWFWFMFQLFFTYNWYSTYIIYNTDQNLKMVMPYCRVDIQASVIRIWQAVAEETAAGNLILHCR